MGNIFRTVSQHILTNFLLFVTDFNNTFTFQDIKKYVNRSCMFF